MGLAGGNSPGGHLGWGEGEGTHFGKGVKIAASSVAKPFMEEVGAGTETLKPDRAGTLSHELNDLRKVSLPC